MGKQRDGAVQKLRTVAFGEDAEIGPRGGERVHGEHGVGVVIAAARHETAKGMILVDVVDPDRIIRHGLEGFFCDLGGERRRAPGLAQHPGKDAIADRRLIGAPFAPVTVSHQFAKAPECPTIVGVVPVVAECRVEVVKRRIEGLEGEREDPRRRVEPIGGDERGIGDEAVADGDPLTRHMTSLSAGLASSARPVNK